jgi:hypothetical protein
VADDAPQLFAALLHLAIRTLGALHLEAGTPHTAFTIGLFVPFSWPSEWNQPPLWYSSVTPSAQMQQCRSTLSRDPTLPEYSLCGRNHKQRRHLTGGREVPA